ncbi:MAG: AAA family ATPase [Gammaproteobacteria bacterium]|nr:AAA family ATPase [Gammaproteobacteria bacterium]
MTRDHQVDWPYPGSRWWKFDFHTHTPASVDTKTWREATGTEDEVTPEVWLRQFMGAGIDCVAVTDHNSGDWIDKLKDAYAAMGQRAEDGSPPEGFRKLTLFPGVEISVSGGFHLLAILDVDATSSDIDTLLGKVDFRGTKGASDAVTRASPPQVVQAVLDAGGIPIPAHADQKKGLLRVNTGTREAAMDANTVREVMANDRLLAVEWVDPALPMPECVGKGSRRVTKVLGSDCHSFHGNGAPGSVFTWIKMADPTLDGLRLALLDGAGVSVRRSDEGEFDPFKTPRHFVTNVEIDSARYMGRDAPERLCLTPYYNALIGGRGTGKSTFVHSLRLVYRRAEELNARGGDTEPRRRFDSFATIAKSRDDDGALRDVTEIRVELCREGVAHRLRWRQDGGGAMIEEQNNDGHWQPSPSQALTAERFPIRLFSQGQIATMAGEGREALLGIIDEAAGIDSLHRDLDDAKRTWATQRARLRELDGLLSRRPEEQRKLHEVRRKLDVLAEAQHADTLNAQQRAVRQRREVDTSLAQLASPAERIEALARGLLLDDLPDGVFEPDSDQDLLEWRRDAEETLGATRNALVKAAGDLADKAGALGNDDRLAAWRRRADKAQTDYSELQETLASQGVSDPQAFGRLLQEREQLERDLKTLIDVAEDRSRLEETAGQQWNVVLNTRKRITQARRMFVQETLGDNRFVRMEVVGFGFDARSVEHSLREVLECQDDRFERDILRYRAAEPNGGLAFDLANSKDDDKEDLLADVKQRLVSGDATLGGHLRNYLERKLERPGFADHVLCWFPEDDLRIEYSRSGDGQAWTAIKQGSQGQRSAALLAFLLAFGDEPLVLDQPEDDLDNHLIYDLIVRQIRENKLRRQLIVVTHNPNVVVNGDAELVHVLDFTNDQCRVVQAGALQQKSVREEVCRVMEGGREAFSRRWARLGREV